jgi:hypothetical protein
MFRPLSDPLNAIKRTGDTYITDTKKSLTINGNQPMQISVKREISKYLSVKRDFAKF